MGSHRGMTKYSLSDRRIDTVSHSIGSVEPTNTLQEDTTMSHRIRRATPAPQWPSFKGTSQYVGTSPVAMAAIYVDPSLGDPALQNAKELLADADRVVSANNAIFGAPGEPVNVIIFALDGQTDGTGGADYHNAQHKGGRGIEVDSSYGKGTRALPWFWAQL